jgi:hypothetical protein
MLLSDCASPDPGMHLYTCKSAHVQDLGMRYVRLDGSTAVSDRLTIVDRCVPDLLSRLQSEMHTM